jgi:hypothetical protein
MATNEAYGHKTDPAEIRKKIESNRNPDHPYDSISRDADFSVAGYIAEFSPVNDPKEERIEQASGYTVNRNTADDPKVIDFVQSFTDDRDPLEAEDEELMTDGGRSGISYAGEIPESPQDRGYDDTFDFPV